MARRRQNYSWGPTVRTAPPPLAVFDPRYQSKAPPAVMRVRAGRGGGGSPEARAADIPSESIVGTWTPASESNLAGWWRADAGVNRTAGIVDTWEDQSGNGRTLENSPTNRPAVITDGVTAGLDAIEFDGVNDFLKTAVFTLDQPFTVYALFKQRTYTQFDRVYSGLTDGYLYQSNTVAANLSMRTGGSVGPTVAPALDTWTVMTNLWNGSNTKSQLHHKTTLGGNPGAGNFGGVVLGASAAASLFGAVSFGEFIVRSGADDALTRFRHVTWLQRRSGLTYYNLICEGDSLTEGAGLGPSSLFPAKLVTLKEPTLWGYQNLAVGGSDVADIGARAAATDLYLDVGTARNVLCVWIGTNDLAVGTSPETIRSEIASYCTKRRTAGWEVAVFTSLPRNGTANANFESDRQQLNQLIRAGYTSWADVLVDVGANTTIGEAGDQNNATYYSDGTHLTSAGHDVVAAELNAVL